MIRHPEKIKKFNPTTIKKPNWLKVKAPISKGEKIADIIVKNKDQLIKTLPLYAQEDLKKVNFFKSLVTSINYLIWGDV